MPILLSISGITGILHGDVTEFYQTSVSEIQSQSFVSRQDSMVNQLCYLPLIQLLELNYLEKLQWARMGELVGSVRQKYVFFYDIFQVN